MHRCSRLPALLLAALSAACLAAAAGARPQPAPIQAFSLADVEVSVPASVMVGKCLYEAALPAASNGPVDRLLTTAAAAGIPAPLSHRPLRCCSHRVQLASASEFGANFDQNAEYLLALIPDNLLYNFRWVHSGAHE